MLRLHRLHKTWISNIASRLPASPSPSTTSTARGGLCSIRRAVKPSGMLPGYTSDLKFSSRNGRDKNSRKPWNVTTFSCVGRATVKKSREENRFGFESHRRHQHQYRIHADSAVESTTFDGRPLQQWRRSGAF